MNPGISNRAAGGFKTTQPYEHSRKAASAAIAKIPFVLARHIECCLTLKVTERDKPE